MNVASFYFSLASDTAISLKVLVVRGVGIFIIYTMKKVNFKIIKPLTNDHIIKDMTSDVNWKPNLGTRLKPTPTNLGPSPDSYVRTSGRWI